MRAEAYISNLLTKKSYHLNRQIVYFLRQVYGVGFFRARRLTLYCGVTKNYNLKVKDVSTIYFHRFQRYTFRNKLIAGSVLKSRRFSLLRFLQQQKLYRGIRFYYGLPVRGQRTHTNRATIKRLRKGRVNVHKKVDRRSKVNKSNITKKRIIGKGVLIRKKR